MSEKSRAFSLYYDPSSQALVCLASFAAQIALQESSATSVVAPATMDGQTANSRRDIGQFWAGGRVSSRIAKIHAMRLLATPLTEVRPVLRGRRRSSNAQ